MIRYQKWITRADLRANPDKHYLFGDNAVRQGLGGQAKEMRGETNALGIATKWLPTMEEQAFFSDDNEHCRQIILTDLSKVQSLLRQNRIVVVPAMGLGTGLSQLPTRAPQLALLIDRFFALYGPVPWLVKPATTAL